MRTQKKKSRKGFLSVSINPRPCHSEPVTDVTGVGIRSLLAGNLRKSAGIMRFRNGLPRQSADWLAMTGFFDSLRNPERDFFFAGGTDCRAGVSAGSQWQGRSDVGIAPTKSQGIRVYGGGQSRPPLRCKARSRAQRDGGDVVPQGHLFRCAPRQDAVPCEQKDSAPAGRCPCI